MKKQLSSVNIGSAPSVALLGISDRFVRGANVYPHLSSLSMIGLRREVIGRFFPLPVSNLNLVFAVYNPLCFGGADIVVRKGDFNDFFTLHLGISGPTEMGTIPPDPIMFDRVSGSPCWIIIAAKFPTGAHVLPQPQTLHFFLKEGEEETSIGDVDFYYARSEPLTTERIAAIRATPRAAASAQLQIGCSACDDHVRAYTALERVSAFERDGWKWYRDLDEKFICRCGNVDLPLHMLRESMHAILGQPIISDLALREELKLTGLYERSALVAMIARFEDLISRKPKESEVQRFMTENPLLFHRFSPAGITPKAPILNRYETDFCIVSASGEVFLIEIEKPTTKLIKKNGDIHAELTHAFEQVRRWLAVIAHHRTAVLEESMGLRLDSITAVHGVVIAGRDQGYDPSALRRIKGDDYGNIVFYSFDDLAAALTALLRGIGDI